MSRFFKSKFESYLNISAKNDYLDKKFKERKLRMGRCLYHYRVANKNVHMNTQFASKAILFQKMFEFQNAIFICYGW
jgi:hypothetical protein